MTQITDIKMSGCRRTMAYHHQFWLKKNLKVESCREMDELMWIEYGARIKMECKTDLILLKVTG